MTEVSELVGQIVTDIKINSNNDEVLFTINETLKYRMFHYQDCCETVAIEEIIGDLNDLINTPILVAETRSNQGDTKWGTYTWTFYEFRTIKGSVTIRWHGESSGYYSEEVNFERIVTSN